MKSFPLTWTLGVIAALVLFLQACSSSEKASNETTTSEKKIGVLLVNHGSRSETWRNELVRLEKNVTDSVLATGEVKGIKTAFMEYTEPSIATRLKEFDKEGFTDVVVVPIFLTVSPHTFEDLPTIMGQKEDKASMEALKLEKIERYVPKAAIHITPNLDFTDVLKRNVLRRAKELSKDAPHEGLVLIGYGDETYDKEWTELFNQVATHVKQEIGISEHSHGWCGHIAHYNPAETTKAVNEVLKKKEKAVVIPVLVAHDEDFQLKIIGGGIDKVANSEKKVSYKPDAILPDPDIQHWVITVANEFVGKIKKS
ncbi:MAG TPA: cobalamin biosynthesis protein CbiX [Runella sp.]|nr:cobalamin biosynthesis protein CbiX [Runella sp.]HAO51648.1 cobalamin biosynthesis protein CbiX [Runella sp.]